MKWDDWLGESTLTYLSQKRYPNILTESRIFSECFPEADRVFLDYPGTTLYEAAAAGLPVMCLHHELLPIQENSRRVFGKSLQSYRTMDEAKQKIKDFLEADPSEYRVALPLTGASAAQVLLDIQNSLQQRSWIGKEAESTTRESMALPPH